MQLFRQLRGNRNASHPSNLNWYGSFAFVREPCVSSKR